MALWSLQGWNRGGSSCPRGGTQAAQKERKEEMMNQQFEEELRSALNRHSIDAYCGIPDFILAGTLCSFLKAMAQCSIDTDAWNGRSPMLVVRGEDAPKKKARKK